MPAHLLSKMLISLQEPKRIWLELEACQSRRQKQQQMMEQQEANSKAQLGCDLKHYLSAAAAAGRRRRAILLRRCLRPATAAAHALPPLSKLLLHNGGQVALAPTLGGGI